MTGITLAIFLLELKRSKAMKKLIIILTVVIWGVFGSSTLNAQPGVSSYFYTALTPYGQWIEIDYGVVVWKPVIMQVDWNPYTQGRWIWTVDGWYWDSYEPFGYITYHYGRWYYDDYYGWIWVPGYEYAPAWVEWRYDDVYIGWAPLPPYATFSVSIGIRFTRSYYTPYSHWNFVRYNYFYNPHVYRYCVGPSYRYRIYTRTKYRTNYSYYNGRVRNYGVDVNIIRTRSGQQIRQRDIVRTSEVRTLEVRGNKNNGRVKTFYVSRDELKRSVVRDVNFKRGERKSTLDVSKIRTETFSGRKTNKDTKLKRNEFPKRNDVGVRNVTKDNKRDVTVRNNKKSNDRNLYKRVETKQRKKINDNINKTFKKKTNVKREKKVERKTVRRNYDVKKREVKKTEKTVVRNKTKKTEKKVIRKTTVTRKDTKTKRNNTRKRRDVKTRTR